MVIGLAARIGATGSNHLYPADKPACQTNDWLITGPSLTKRVFNARRPDSEIRNSTNAGELQLVGPTFAAKAGSGGTTDASCPRADQQNGSPHGGLRGRGGAGSLHATMAVQADRALAGIGGIAVPVAEKAIDPGKAGNHGHSA